tara:strand:+ start:21594 stop:22352 length:759 start_codon:yes stop_codon:yes gene_type:complete
MGDVPIRVNEGLTQQRLGSYYFLSEDGPVGDVRLSLWMEQFKGDAPKDLTPEIDLEERTMNILFPVNREGENHFSEYYVRRYLGFFAGILSDDFNLVHGGGILYNGKGVLIVGGSKAGKSTLISEMQETGAKVIDDDMVMTDWNVMERTCRSGHITANGHNSRSLVLHDDFYRCNVDYVVVLTRGMGLKASEYRQGSTDGMAEVCFDSVLPESLFEQYSKKFTAPSPDLSIYYVGTTGPSSVSRDVIISLIS